MTMIETSGNRIAVVPSDKLAAGISARLEALPQLPTHIRWATIIGIGCFLDGFTTLVVAAAMAVLVTTLHFNFDRVGLLISASFLGMLVGAILFGAASERYGRRIIFVLSVAMFGVLSIAAAFAWDFNSLFWLRVVQGLGLGGAVPVGATLVSECLPAAARGRTFSFAYALLFALGYMLAPLIGFVLIAVLGPELGWRALFAVAGLALPFALVAYFGLPESPRWLATKGRLVEADAIVGKLEENALRRGLVLGKLGELKPVPHRTTRLSEAFGRDYLGRTLLVWTLFLVIYFVQYGLNAWLPTLYVKIGGLTPQSALGLSIVNGAVMLGAAVVFALTVDRIGRKSWFMAGFGLSIAGIAAGTYALAVLHLTTWPVLFCSALLMTAGSGVNAGLIYLYAPELFPTRMRAWSTSTGSAASRLGSIVAPIAIGALLQAHLGLVSVFILLGAICVLGLVTVALFGIETKQETLEEIAA